MTCLQAVITNDKLVIKKFSLTDDIEMNKAFSNRLEGMLIELLR